MTTDQQAPDEFADLTELMRHEYAPPAHESVEAADRRRRRRTALRWIAASLALLLILVTTYAVWALNAPLADPVMQTQEPAVVLPPAAIVPLDTEGSAAISVAGAEEYLGEEAAGIWATSGSDAPRPIASITKLITALVILDAHPLSGPGDRGPTIVFDKADHDLYDQYYMQGATIAAMPTGSSMSLRDALATMLIPSASNYADAVSTWAFGSRWGFLQAAQAWLVEHRLTGTTIVEPTGISRDNVSTPRDLIRLGKLAAADPVIAKIVATPSITLPGPGPLLSTNGLLGSEGITGLKTGNLGAGAFNMLYSASLDVGAAERLTIVGVVLGGATRESVNSSILVALSGLRSGFHDVPLAARGDRVGSLRTPWGSSAAIVVSDEASIFTWSDTPISVSMEMSAPAAYDDGEVVGRLTWTAGPHSESVDLEIEGEIEQPTGWWRLTHPSELLGR